MKEIRETLPPEVSESESFKIMQAQVETLLNITGALASEGRSQNHTDYTISASDLNSKEHFVAASIESNASNVKVNQSRAEGIPSTPETARAKAKEVMEQFEPGVYVTLLQLPNGTKVFKRIKFRYSFFLLYHLKT